MSWWELCTSLFCCKRSIQTSPQTMSVNSNSSAASDKKYNSKRSYGYIRPPNIQRDSQSQVTLKGWLFRLEGGALRQWRRRWFVLTDYCLFYYRDSDENKLLGSVILPSYRISPCSANDKITRKYAFKAEHSNMKTYFFAVESRELMIQWMNALCLATIMQTFTRSHHSTDQLSVPPTPGLDEEDSGFVSYQSRKLQDQDDPQATLDSSFASAQSTLDFSRDIDGNIVTNDGASDSGFVSSHYGSQSGIPYSVYTRGKTGQLYYAAAPPKPKRLHASYTALPQCVPDLVPPQEINLGRGKFVPLCDYESFYEFGKNERSYRKCDNWEGNYDNLTSEGGKYHQPQPELYLPMSAALKKTPGSQSMLESERDYENTAIYRDSLQPLSNNPRQPPLIRRHSDIFGDNMTGYDQQLQKMPSTSSKHPFHSQPRVEKHDHDVYDKGGRDLACVYDACDSRVLGNIPGNTYHRTKTESGYQTNTSFKGHQYQDQVIGSLYPGSGNNSDRQVLDRQVHRADNSRGIVSARPIFVNENIYVPFDADRKEPSVCVFQHGTGSSNGQESQSNSLREESMKKLLEWKERMLLSPLTKINNHEETKNIAPATSSGSPGIPPPRPPLPEEYCHEVLQNLELHEMQQKLHELQLQSNGINTVVSPGQVGAPELSDNIPVSEVTPKPRRLSCGEVELQIHRHMKKAIGGRRDNDKSQKSNRTLYRSNEHHQSTSALCRLATSYSSDDEESPSSSSNVRGNYRPKVRRASYRGKRSNQHKAVGRVSVSDSELHVHRSSMKCRLLQFSSGLTAKHKNVSVSAGELLEKSHEELVLLLIQLRQNQRQLLKSQQQCHLQMAKEQRLMQMNSYENEHKRNYMMLCQQMEKLQEEEKGIRHLVNLVANLVKLRTLKSSTENNTASPPRLDGVRIEKYIPSEKMLEFAHHLQERQRLRGEIESIEMASLDHEGLEEKLSRLYQLNYLVQEEYSEFVFIQKDEEMLEQSLKTVQEKLSEVGRDNPVGLEKLRKQQRLIEKELAHIYSMLSQSTVRLQQGILKESQVEHKILVFRQKMEHALVVSHRRKEMSSISKADLEAELLRLQSLLESLAKHRQEISNAIQTLKFNSKQKRLPGFQKVRGKVSGVVGFAALPSKRKNQSAYMETDLDSCSSQEFCVVKNPQPRLQWQEMAEVIDHSRTLKNGPMLDIAQPENQNTLDQERQGRLSRHNQKTSLNWSGQLVGEYGKQEMQNYTDQQCDYVYKHKHVDQRFMLSQQNQLDEKRQKQSELPRLMRTGENRSLSSQNLYCTQTQGDHIRINGHNAKQDQPEIPTTFNLHNQHLLYRSAQDVRSSKLDMVFKSSQLDQNSQKQSDQQMNYYGQIQTDLRMVIRHQEHDKPNQQISFKQLDQPVLSDQNVMLNQHDYSDKLKRLDHHRKHNSLDENSRLNEQNQYSRLNQCDSRGKPNNPVQNSRLNQQNQYSRLNQCDSRGKPNNPEQNSRLNQQNTRGRLEQLLQHNELKNPETNSGLNEQAQCGRPDQQLQSNKLIFAGQNPRLNQQDQHGKSDQLLHHDKPNHPEPNSGLNKQAQCGRPDQQLQSNKLIFAGQNPRLNQQDQHGISDQLLHHDKLNHPEPNSGLNQHRRPDQLLQHEKLNHPELNLQLNQQVQHETSDQLLQHNKLNHPEPNSGLNQQVQFEKSGQLLQYNKLNLSEQNSKLDEQDQHERLNQPDQHSEVNQLKGHTGETEVAVHQSCNINVVGLPLKVLPQEKPKKFDTIRKSSSCTSDKKGGQAAAWMVDSVKNHEVAKDKPLAPNRPTSLFSPTRKVQTHRRTLSAYERLFGGASTSSLSTPSAEQRASGYHSQTSPRHHGQSQRKPKRRHHTITGSGSQPLLGISSPRRFSPSSRHIRMDRNSRTASTPDIVRSTIRKSEVFDEKVIDRELGLPQKIDIPERYIEDEPEKLSTAEKLKRNQKAENIRKMLCEVTAYEESSEAEGGVSETMKKKVDDEKKKRAHLLALNHTIAKEVMEKSKIVAMIATLERLHPDTEEQMEGEVQDEDWSPVQSLPVIQQRENYFT
ncbi:uncharacterized protein LOC143256443 isoform X3 [Tachypleus tridentatus]|uniref:uncharacterized protein LOC143256443 isoform X3 n=1 Tax=Tachypleus tridentatus TaxID=6853 RepID=UPI003FD24168